MDRATDGANALITESYNTDEIDGDPLWGLNGLCISAPDAVEYNGGVCARICVSFLDALPGVLRYADCSAKAETAVLPLRADPE